MQAHYSAIFSIRTHRSGLMLPSESIGLLSMQEQQTHLFRIQLAARHHLGHDLQGFGQEHRLAVGAILHQRRRCCSNQGTIPQFGDLIS